MDQQAVVSSGSMMGDGPAVTAGSVTQESPAEFGSALAGLTAPAYILTGRVVTTRVRGGVRPSRLALSTVTFMVIS